MEAYVLIDSVLQATHMSNPPKKAKHLKRYELKTARADNRPYDQTYQNPDIFRIFRERKSDRNCLTTQGNTNGPNEADTDKIKTKFLLEDNEKINEMKKQCKVDTFLTDFFIKKEINPKACHRENTPRQANLLKTRKAQTCLFYDIKFHQVQRRERNCLITPDNTSRRRNKDSSLLEENEKSKEGSKLFGSIDIKKLIKEEWEEQRKKRNIQSKMGIHAARKKAYLLKQAKKMQEQGKGKQFQQPISRQYDKQKHGRGWSKDISSNKSLRPLSQEEIKTQTVGIMRKYGVDSSKYYFKYFSS